MKFSLRTDLQGVNKRDRRKWQSLYIQTLVSKRVFHNFYYNITKYELSRLTIKAKRTTYALAMLLILLESRIDVVLYRSYFVFSVYQIRQLIKHRHILLNGKIVSHCGIRVRYYDVLSFKTNKLRKKILNKIFTYIKLTKCKVISLFEVAYPLYYEVYYPLLLVTILPYPLPDKSNIYFGVQNLS